MSEIEGFRRFVCGLGCEWVVSWDNFSLRDVSGTGIFSGLWRIQDVSGCRILPLVGWSGRRILLLAGLGRCQMSLAGEVPGSAGGIGGLGGLGEGFMSETEWSVAGCGAWGVVVQGCRRDGRGLGADLDGVRWGQKSAGRWQSREQDGREKQL